ncbi:DUF397 domain-containing protein [Amycolatopsis plumensis]|uniref:DUF397 domain-containing protein n=1 Tax=Amycolatopsis plumensis TaxID=236508 RepID=A0ABV5UKD2_9PSEU
MKSSTSGSGGNDDCVEVATTLGHVFLRDSKFPHPVLAFTHTAWGAFLETHS